MGDLADLLPARRARVRGYIPPCRGFSPGPGLRPITPTPLFEELGVMGVVYVITASGHRFSPACVLGIARERPRGSLVSTSSSRTLWGKPVHHKRQFISRVPTAFQPSAPRGLVPSRDCGRTPQAAGLTASLRHWAGSEPAQRLARIVYSRDYPGI